MLTNVRGIFQPFSPPLTTCGINRFFFFCWPDSPTLILVSCERREEEKERWECQRGGTRQLRVINHCHGGGRDERDERHERWSAADMAGISLQRWDESTYSAAFAFVADMRLWHHILPETERWRCWESVKQERPCKKKKKKGGEVNASRSDIWIELWITASRAAPRGSEYLMKSYVWWKCLESRGRGSLSDPMFTCTDTEITDQSC